MITTSRINGNFQKEKENESHLEHPNDFLTKVVEM